MSYICDGKLYLHKGKFSTITLCKKNKYAIREYSNDLKFDDIIFVMKHKNLVEYVKYEYNKKLFIYTKYIDSYPLWAYEIPEKKKSKVIKQICEGINYIHQNIPNYLNRVLTPNRVLVNHNYHVYLSNVGFVYPNTNTEFKRCFKENSYSGIEIMLGNKNEKSDVFSFGMLMFSILTNEYNRLPSYQDKQKTGFIINTHIDNKYIEIMRDCINFDYTKRPTIKYVKNLL
jgi:serine/threonine protein kinase